MKTIEVDDDLYRYLVGQTEKIGESASSILRRLLGLSSGGVDGIAQRSGTAFDSELEPFLSSESFRRLRSATDRYVAILGELHRRDPEGFSAILGVSGRRRKYFAESEAELIDSGRSVEPKQVPGSHYYAMTNASTSYKKAVLARVMRTLKYDDRARMEAARALVS